LIDEVKKQRIRLRSRDKIFKICELLDGDQILSILYYMLQDYNNRIRGFPDLFVFNDDEFFFCEVKANTDVLSAYQVRNHEQLLNTGINVCLFSINKSKSYIKEEKWKYFNEDFYDVDNFKEAYDFKIKIANRIHKELEENNINEIKTKFFSNYDLYTYMGFLNLMKDYNPDKKVKTIENIDEVIINQAEKEGTKIRNLRYLSKGLYYEERGLYPQAIEEYKNAKDFYGYNKLCICYRKNKDYENEVNLTYGAINDISGIPDDCKIYFKTRAQRFTNNKKRITVYKTNNKCPICGGNEVVVVLQRRENLKIRICDNGSCYWYGGVYDSDTHQLEQVTDLKEFNVDNNLKKSLTRNRSRHRRKKQTSLFEKSEKPEKDENYAKNLEIKYDLILKGEALLANENYNESIDFYNGLINHELFINDYYPFVMLVKSYKGLNQHDKEVEVIQQFFKSGRYCKKSALNRFKIRLEELDQLGYFDYSTINELEEEFRNNGAKNMNKSRVPLPRARDIKASKNRLRQTPLKYSPDYFDSDVEFDKDISHDEKVKFKYELILKGESLFKSRKYDKAIAFYTRLLTHELFINDYYPYLELAKVLHKDKRYDMEVDVIKQFFKSGRYCDKNQIMWFKRRLRRLTRFGYYDFSKFSTLEYEFDKNGALKEHLSNQPVPSANDIKKIMDK
ncbi:MAG: VRR-NUC domain-containing protein, partial [Methanobrevibacter sp.]|nr:VRR-NUC domain-containing protein [Methanobrevibacter sp.]